MFCFWSPKTESSGSKLGLSGVRSKHENQYNEFKSLNVTRVVILLLLSKYLNDFS